MKKRKHIVFTGRVQAVGFRWTACNLARDRGLTGWVRNEYDGSVTMEVQGEQEDIDWMVERLMTDRYIRIDNLDVSSRPLSECETGFEVRY